ncbi:MAG: cation:proton antiporter [Rhizobacter sp.]|nr:cation:proton antiporter [Rhizobacter sp.]
MNHDKTGLPGAASPSPLPPGPAVSKPALADMRSARDTHSVSLRHRLLPAPVLSLCLFVLWLVLAQSTSAGQVVIGIVVALLAPALTVPLRPVPVRLHRPAVALRLIGHVMVDVVTSNVTVMLGILRSDRRPPSSGFVQVPLDLRDPNGLAALAVIMCITPGTVWSELSLDGSTLMIHVFDLNDEAGFIEQVKSRYERPLMEVFQ